MSYNFSYSCQYGTVHHWPFTTGDTLVLNLSANSQQCCYDESASSGNLNRLAICPKPNYGESLNNWERSVVTPDQKPCLPCPDTNHDQRPYPDKPRPDTNYDQRPYPEKPRPDPNPNPKPHPDDRKGCQDDGEPYTVVAKEITADHADPNKECGYYAGYYKSYGHVGHYGFNTACILKKWFPNFDKNPALKEKLENVTSPVMAGNFKLAIVGDNIDYTWAKASDMWCRQCQNYDDDKACTWEHNGVKAHSTCYTAGSNWSTIYSHNFFSETECPNLITSEVHAREKPKEIYIKLVEPIVLYDHSTQKIINRNGKMTDQNYFACKEYINSNLTNDGKVAENSCDKDYYKAQCQSCIKALEEALWTAKDPIKLKIPVKKQVAYSLNHGDTQNEDPFSSLGHNKMQDDEAFISVDNASLI